jgi:hypothetical protein
MRQALSVERASRLKFPDRSIQKQNRPSFLRGTLFQRARASAPEFQRSHTCVPARSMTAAGLHIPNPKGTLHFS